eukprot:6414583-Amphidinium_carterae.2
MVRYIHTTSKAIAKPNPYKPTHCPTSKQAPPMVAQLDNISVRKELTLENNKDTMEKNEIKMLMDSIQVQPWWQYEDDVSKCYVMDIGMNREIYQLINVQGSGHCYAQSRAAPQCSWD